ncbi:GNAT family N-acetyltransferase [Weissella diestrammenae]|uniref:GNAT family N-acetyltransferase n=1 Tax=Weissella diestrammenae TaxID=1162633 RepID=A0A7G9T5C5_9LACO|nr:GNAT family N-acetyltransferase [Weissella diestrammenae]MCM0583159.1 GNAT family N-acetyltransferase [Weissella diestrammenae]QNN75300.1 GNAT family N-acetyltransferase [Weissella diestrammenae]
MKQSDIRIVAAQAEDQLDMLQLEQIIFSDMALTVYQTLSPEAVLDAVYLATLTDSKSRYHYSRGIVAKDNDNQVLGVLFGYLAAEEPILDTEFQKVLAEKYQYHELVFPDSEVYPNEWYLDSIAVNTAARGMGVGSRLLAAVDQYAKAAGATVVGLNVDDANPKAQKLYERVGFQPVGDLYIGVHHYTHMQRQIQ